MKKIFILVLLASCGGPRGNELAKKQATLDSLQQIAIKVETKAKAKLDSLSNIEPQKTEQKVVAIQKDTLNTYSSNKSLSQKVNYNSSLLKSVELFPEEYVGKTFYCEEVGWKAILNESMIKIGYYSISFYTKENTMPFAFMDERLESVVNKILTKKLLKDNIPGLTANPFDDWLNGNLFAKLITVNSDEGVKYLFVISRIEFKKNNGQVIVYDDK